MDAKGNIVLATPEEAKRRDLTPIPDDQLQAVMNMNRKQRRAWAAQMRRLVRRAKGGEK